MGAGRIYRCLVTLRQTPSKWLQNILVVPCAFKERARHEHLFRSMQLAHQASMREKKNILQKSLMFHSRATTLLEDFWL